MKTKKQKEQDLAKKPIVDTGMDYPELKQKLEKYPELGLKLEPHKIRIEELQNQHRETLETAARVYWELGKILKDAKQTIIDETGDKRAKGFLAWAYINFGYSSTTVARMIKAHDKKLTDPKEIWANEKKLEQIPTQVGEIIIVNDNEKGKPPLPKPIKYVGEVETRNRWVVNFFDNLENKADTTAKFKKIGEIPKEICSTPSCENGLSLFNLSGLCRDCQKTKTQNAEEQENEKKAA